MTEKYLEEQELRLRLAHEEGDIKTLYLKARVFLIRLYHEEVKNLNVKTETKPPYCGCQNQCRGCNYEYTCKRLL